MTLAADEVRGRTRVIVADFGESDPRARGRALGLRHGYDVVRTVGLYRDFYRSVGIPDETVEDIADRCRSALLEWSPALQEELDALAAGAEEATGDRCDPQAVMTVCARTEILATLDTSEQGECSTAVVLPENGRAPRSMQTWDWHEFLVPASLVLTYTTAAGVRVKTFTEFGAPAKIGVNDAGVGVHFNILHHASDHSDGGVPVHAIARRILEEAHSVDDAVEIARSASVSASTVLTVVSAEPAAACIELCPAGTAVVTPVARLDGEAILFHTNHFLNEELAAGERTPDVSTTYARLDHLGSVLAASAGDLGPSEFATALCGADGADAPICMTPDLALPQADQWSTLLTVGLDVSEGTMEYFSGDPTEFAAGRRTVV